MADEYKDLVFPKSGIDLAHEFDTQRNESTREANNVRYYEPGTGRARGGARPGLGRFIQTTVNGVHLVQHLALIVDPTVEGLLADLDDEGALTDPSSSNRRRRLPPDGRRKMRVGGNGRSPLIKTPRPTLTITADDQTKSPGDTFTFAGTEFTSNGLEILDTITSATITSIGSPASKPVGDYPIKIKNAIGVTGEGVSLKSKYKIKYVQGTMTVGGGHYYMLVLAAAYGGTFDQALATLFVNGVSVKTFSVDGVNPSKYCLLFSTEGEGSGNVPADFEPPPDSTIVPGGLVELPAGNNTIAIRLVYAEGPTVALACRGIVYRVTSDATTSEIITFCTIVGALDPGTYNDGPNSFDADYS